MADIKTTISVNSGGGIESRLDNSSFRKNLVDLTVLVNDKSSYSPYYFNVIRKPQELKLGGNLFEFAPPRNRFKKDTQIIFEAVDSQNNPLAYEILPQKEGSHNIRLCIFVYNTTVEGPGVISIVGETELDECGCPVPPEWQDKTNVRWSAITPIISTEISDTIEYDVAPTVTVSETKLPWQYQTFEDVYQANPLNPGSSYTVSGSYHSKYDSTPITSVHPNSGSAGGPNGATGNGKFTYLKGNLKTSNPVGQEQALIEVTSGNLRFSSSMVGGRLYVSGGNTATGTSTHIELGPQDPYYPPVGGSPRGHKPEYSASIVSILSATKAIVTPWYYYTPWVGNNEGAGGARPAESFTAAQGGIIDWTETSSSVSYTDPTVPDPPGNMTRVERTVEAHTSYIDVNINDLKPICGVATEVEVFMKSNRVEGPITKLTEFPIELNNVIIDDGLKTEAGNSRKFTEIGKFSNQHIINEYWDLVGNLKEAADIAFDKTYNSTVLQDSVHIRVNDHSLSGSGNFAKFYLRGSRTSELGNLAPIDLNAGTSYFFNFDAVGAPQTDEEDAGFTGDYIPRMEIYVSGSSINPTNKLDRQEELLGERIGIVENNGKFQQQYLGNSFEYKPTENHNNISLVFVIRQGDWYIKDVAVASGAPESTPMSTGQTPNTIRALIPMPAITKYNDEYTFEFRYKNCNGCANKTSGPITVQMDGNDPSVFLAGQPNQTILSPIYHAVNAVTMSKNFFLTGSMYVSGNVYSQEFHTNIVSSSILFDEGDTVFGNTITDVHITTGSIYVTSSYITNETNNYIIRRPEGDRIFNIYEGNITHSGAIRVDKPGTQNPCIIIRPDDTVGWCDIQNGAGNTVIGIDDATRDLYFYDRGDEWIRGTGDDIRINAGGHIRFSGGTNDTPGISFVLSTDGQAAISNGIDQPVVLIDDGTRHLYFGDVGDEYIVGNTTDLTLNSGRDINLTSTRGVNITGDVTASNHISASGTVYASNIRVSGSGATTVGIHNTGNTLAKWEWHRDSGRKWVMYNDGRTNALVPQDSFVFKQGTASDGDDHINMSLHEGQGVWLHGNVTASGNISSSGHISASLGHLFISTSDAEGKPFLTVLVDTGSGRLYYTGSYGGGGSGGGGTPRAAGTGLLLSGNDLQLGLTKSDISSNAWYYVPFADGQTGAQQLETSDALNFNPFLGELRVGHSVHVHVSGSVTASKNIWVSGSTGPETFISASNLISSQHVTASGNISASGTIIGNIISGSIISGSFRGDASGLREVGLDRGSDAQGDILVRGTSAYERLGAGSTHQILFMGDATPEWNSLIGGAGLTLSNKTFAVGAGTGITVNTDDVAVTAAQTGITSIYNTGLIIGRASNDTTINFTTDDEIILDAGSTEIGKIHLKGLHLTGSISASKMVRAPSGSFEILSGSIISGSFYGDGTNLSGLTANAAGADKHIQYNNGGTSLGGEDQFTYDDTTKGVLAGTHVTISNALGKSPLKIVNLPPETGDGLVLQRNRLTGDVFAGNIQTVYNENTNYYVTQFIGNPDNSGEGPADGRIQAGGAMVGKSPTVFIASGSITFYTGSVSQSHGQMATSSAIFDMVYDKTGDKSSFVMSGSKSAKLYFSGSTSGKLGIGTTDPKNQVDIKADSFKVRSKDGTKEVEFGEEGQLKTRKFSNVGGGGALETSGSELVMSFTPGTFDTPVRARAGDVMGSIRWEDESFSEEIKRNAATPMKIDGIITSADSAGVAGYLSIKTTEAVDAGPTETLGIRPAGLYVTGSVNASSNITTKGNINSAAWFAHTGDDDTGLYMEDNLVNLKAGGKSVIKLDWANSNDKILINNTNEDIDLHVMADNGNVILATDAANNRVGIGVTDPDETLEVAGTIKVNSTWPQLKLTDDDSTDVMTVGMSGNTGYIKSSDTSNGMRIRRSDNFDIMRWHMDTEKTQVSGSGGLSVVGHVTASGNISSSATIQGDTLIATRNVSASKVYAADGFYHSDDVAEDTYIKFPTGDKVKITAGDVNFMYVWQKDSDVNKLWFNYDKDDTDIVLRGDTDDFLIYTDASTDRVGIGTGFPTKKLTVAGNVSSSGAISTLSHVTASGNISSSGTVSAFTASIAGPIRGKSLQMYNANWKGNQGTTEVFVPLSSQPDEQTTGSGMKEHSAIIMPCAGRVKEIILRMHWTTGITDPSDDAISWKMYTRPLNARMNGSTQIGDTITMLNPTQGTTDANNTRTTGELDGTYHYDKYDALAISMQWTSAGPTNNADRIYVTVVVEHDWETIGY